MPAAQTIFKVDEIKLVAVFRMAGAYDRHGHNAFEIGPNQSKTL